MKTDHTKPYAVWSEDSRQEKSEWTGRLEPLREPFMVLHVPGKPSVVAYDVEYESAGASVMSMMCAALDIPIFTTFPSRAFTLDIERFKRRQDSWADYTDAFTN